MMQNNSKCSVYLWDKLVGEMILVKEKIYFKYDSSFDMEISPLSLPLSQTQYEFSTYTFQESIAGVFSDSLPDSFGMKIIQNYFSREYENYNPNTIDKLLFIGDVSLGALSYRPAIGHSQKVNVPIVLSDAKKYKKEILQQNSYSSLRELIDMYKSFSPAGGARQKMILSHNIEKHNFYIGEARKGDISLIVKIDESSTPNELVDTSVEFIYSKLARKCEINMPNTYLFEDDDGFKHFAIQRFDIDPDGERLHVHTLAGLLNFEKSTKLDYEKFMFIAKKHLFVSQEDIQEIFRRMIFNYVYNNNDDHLKNHSFIMSKKGKWRLSPAYDLMYNNTNGQREMMMSINSKSSHDVKYNDFKVLAKSYKVENYREIIEKVLASKKYFEILLDKYLDNTKKYDKLLLLNTREIVLRGEV